MGEEGQRPDIDRWGDAQEERKELWDYYWRTTQMRTQAIEWCIRLVAIPATVIGGAMVWALRSGTTGGISSPSHSAAGKAAAAAAGSIGPPDELLIGGGALLIILFLVGLAWVIFSSAETGNARVCWEAIKENCRSCRELRGEEYPHSMSQFIAWKDEADYGGPLQTISRFRLGGMAFINAAVLVVGIRLFLHGWRIFDGEGTGTVWRWWMGVGLFTLVSTAQLIVSKRITDSYGGANFRNHVAKRGAEQRAMTDLVHAVRGSWRASRAWDALGIEARMSYANEIALVRGRAERCGRVRSVVEELAKRGEQGEGDTIPMARAA